MQHCPVKRLLNDRWVMLRCGLRGWLSSLARTTAIQSEWDCWKWPLCGGWQREVKGQQDLRGCCQTHLWPVNTMLDMNGYNGALSHTQTHTFWHIYWGETSTLMLKNARGKHMNVTYLRCLMWSYLRRSFDSKSNQWESVWENKRRERKIMGNKR